MIVYWRKGPRHPDPFTLAVWRGVCCFVAPRTITIAFPAQVAFLQEKVHQTEMDKLDAERRIREETATEMKEYIEATHAEMTARMEEVRLH